MTRKGGRPSPKVPKRYVAALEKGLKEYMAKKKLKLTKNPRTRTGSKKLSKQTEKNYEKHYDGLFIFSAMIGAYDTCFTLNKHAPSDFCPSMDDRVVALYMQYKTKPKGTKLMDKGEEVFNIFDEPILCNGEWKDPGNCDQFLSAITRIHHSLQQQGQYTRECINCIKSYKKDNKSTGCVAHAGQFKFWQRGNPRTSELVQNAYHEAKDTCSKHVVKGSYQLLPQETIDIRSNLLSTGKKEDLQLYCIMLVSIYLFLRHDEFHLIHLDDIKPEFSAVEKDKVINLCIQIKGKTDKVIRNMILWAYDDAPLLCPVRHLLAYVHLCEIKDGLLFPSFKNPSKPRSYESVMDTLNSRFVHILNRNARLTTHTFRKTGYLFALWGGADLQTARVSARHKSDIMAQRYADCSLFLLQTATAKDINAKYVVGRFKMAIIIHPESARSLNEETTNIFQNLHQLSQLFIEQIGISAHHGGRLRLKTVIKHALAFQPGVPIEEELAAALSPLSIDARNCISQLFSKLKHSLLNENARLRREMEERHVPACATTTHTAALPTTTTCEQQQRPAKRKRGGDDNIEEIRAGIKKLKGASRLTYILTIPEKVEELNLTESARGFINKCVHPVLRCLKKHFNGDESEFLRRWPLDGAISSFGKKCNSKKDVCGT